MSGPPNNIPLRAKGYLESGIGLITKLTLSRTLTLTPTLTLTKKHSRQNSSWESQAYQKGTRHGTLNKVRWSH